MKLSDLQNKNVINTIDGKLIGKIIDVMINENGTMTGFIVEKYRFFISMFSNHNEVEIKWNQINKIGEDVILVTLSGIEI